VAFIEANWFLSSGVWPSTRRLKQAIANTKEIAEGKSLRFFIGKPSLKSAKDAESETKIGKDPFSMGTEEDLTLAR
jgi:hypothetical protein